MSKAEAVGTIAKIKEHLSGGGVVQVCTMLRAVQYERKHIDMFVEKGNQPYVRRGRGLDFIGGCKIRFGRYAS